MKLALTAKLRNGVLWELSEKLGSQTALANELGATPMLINNWMNFRYIPKHLDSPRLIAIEAKLIEKFGVTLEDVFPPELRAERTSVGRVAFKTKLTAIAEVPISQLTAAENRALLTTGSEFEAVEDREFQDHATQLLNSALQSLTPREERILKLRFGLEDGEEHPLDEVADIFSVSRERIRQIEAKALRKLRHPSRSHRLKSLVTDQAPTVSLQRVNSDTKQCTRRICPVQPFSDVEALISCGYEPSTQLDAQLIDAQRAL